MKRDPAAVRWQGEWCGRGPLPRNGWTESGYRWERRERESHSGVGGARCPVGESEQDGSETGHTLNFSNPALSPTRMTDSDWVIFVRVMAKRTPFSERAKELPAEAEERRGSGEEEQRRGRTREKERSVCGGAYLRLSCPRPRQDCQLA